MSLVAAKAVATISWVAEVLVVDGVDVSGGGEGAGSRGAFTGGEVALSPAKDRRLPADHCRGQATWAGL